MFIFLSTYNQGQDFSEDKLMNSGNLYSLFLLNSDESPEDHAITRNDFGMALSPPMPDLGVRIKKEAISDNDDEEIDVENDGTGKKDAGSQHKRKVAKRRASEPSSHPQENGHKPCDALFEGMPFYELQGKEVGKSSKELDEGCT